MKLLETIPGDDNFRIYSDVLRNLDYSPLQLKTKSTAIENEFLHTGLVALDDFGNPVGRLAIYNNTHLKYNNLKTFTVGGYECINDLKVSKLLFDKAIEISKLNNVEYLIGPMNGSSWYDYRYSDNYDELFFSEVFHKDYYINHFILNEFNVIGRYYSSIDENLEIKHNTIEREKELTAEGITFRNIDFKNYEKELELIYDLCEVAFINNFLFTPISKPAFLEKYKSLIHFLKEELIILAFDKSGNLIGFILSFDDIYSNTNKRLIVKTLARHPDRKWMGLGNILSDKIQKFAIEKQYHSIIHSFMYNEGNSVNLSKKYSTKLFKNYNLYGKEI